MLHVLTHSFPTRRSADHCGEALEGRLRYTRADRTGSPYDGTVPLQFGFVEGFIDEEPGGFEGPPALRRLNLASRQRDQLGANLTYTPLTWLALSVDGSYSNDDYNKSELGLHQAKVDRKSGVKGKRV